MKKLNGRLADLEKDVSEVKESIASLETKQDNFDEIIVEVQNSLVEVKKTVDERTTSVQS